MFVRLFVRLAGWLAGWLANWLAGWLVGWLVLSSCVLLLGCCWLWLSLFGDVCCLWLLALLVYLFVSFFFSYSLSFVLLFVLHSSLLYLSAFAFVLSECTLSHRHGRVRVGFCDFVFLDGSTSPGSPQPNKC